MKHFIFEVKLTIQAPFLSHAIGTKEYKIDTATNRYQNMPIINGSLIKGNIRETWEYFCKKSPSSSGIKKDEIDRWLGKPSEHGFLPQPGALNFDYFWKLVNTKLLDTPRVPRHRIGINQSTGTVERGNLQVIESPFAVGEFPEFCANINAWLESKKEADRVQKWLKKALEYIGALGALKGVGFGKLIASSVEFSEASHDQLSINPDDNTQSLDLLFTLDRPLCIAKPHVPDSNGFVSEAYIPGGVIKGAFARTLENASGELGEALQLDQLVFSHAFPAHAPNSTRPIPVPLSFAVVGEKVIDLALYKTPVMYQQSSETGEGNNFIAPAFQSDWKSSDEERVSLHLKNYGIETTINPQRILSVRTAIDSGTRSAARSQLFSLECIDHNDKNRVAVPWRMKLSLDHIPVKNRKGIAKKLVDIMSTYGIHGIGKTKANARFEQCNLGLSTTTTNTIEAIGGRYFIVLLCSDARMLPDRLDIPSSCGGSELKEHYSNYFQQVSGGSLEVSHFFARQKLYGGNVYHSRFRHQHHYAPEWLTEAGSVFVLTADDRHETTAQDCLAKWQNTGLPVADDRDKDSWQTDPLIPQNGYGEIVVNHPLHSRFSDTGEGKMIAIDQVSGEKQ